MPLKHWLVYLCLTAVVVATGNLPFTSSDVGQLRPVQTIALSIQADQVVVQTDTGDRGIGDSWPTAWADLVLTAPGTIFVGTAGFLLLEESATGLLPQLLEDLSQNGEQGEKKKARKVYKTEIETFDFSGEEEGAKS